MQHDMYNWLKNIKPVILQSPVTGAGGADIGSQVGKNNFINPKLG